MPKRRIEEEEEPPSIQDRAQEVGPLPEENELQTTILKKRIQEAEARGEDDLFIILAELVDDLDDRHEPEKIVRALVACRYSPATISPALAANRFGINEIAQLFEPYKLSEVEWVETLYPIAERDTEQDSLHALFQSVQEAENLEWSNTRGRRISNPVSFIRPLLGHGAMIEQITRALHQETGWMLGRIVSELPLRYRVPSVLADLAKAADIDLEDGDELTSLEDDLDFDEQEFLTLFHAYGFSAVQAVRAADDVMSLREDLNETVRFFQRAGYDRIDILVALWEEEDYVEIADLVDAALEEGWPQEDIVRFLQAAHADPEELEDALRQNDVPIGRRVALLHAVLFPQGNNDEPSQRTVPQGVSDVSEA